MPTLVMDPAPAEIDELIVGRNRQLSPEGSGVDIRDLLRASSSRVIDDREAFANAERFPMATELYTSYADAFEKIQPNSSTYLLIVTRGHAGDMRVLDWAIRTEARGFVPRYIGMMGSQRKVIAVYKALEKEGLTFAQLDRVNAPVGLDIGALTPEEIAISITAELIAVRRNSSNQNNKSIKLSEIAFLQRD